METTARKYPLFLLAFLLGLAVVVIQDTDLITASGAKPKSQSTSSQSTSSQSTSAATKTAKRRKRGRNSAETKRSKARRLGKTPVIQDAKNTWADKPDPPRDPAFAKYGIYEKTAPHATPTQPVNTTLPLRLNIGDRIALVGNTLFDRAQLFGDVEALLQQGFPRHHLIVRNLSWSADTPDLQPRPENFADLEQHLTHERVDVIFVAYGFNESFAGPSGVDPFRKTLSKFVAGLKSKAFNGKTAPRIVLISPIANENVAAVNAADRNNQRIRLYMETVKSVAAEQHVGFVDVFTATKDAMWRPKDELTINGCHLTRDGYRLLAKILYKGLFGKTPPPVNEFLRAAIIDKNRQYNRRYRPLNTFYYTGGRNTMYGYLDFLPAMKNFDIMVANRNHRIWAIAQGRKVLPKVDDSNVPMLPEPKQGRGANRWMSAKDELRAFVVDPRFEVNLFAGEEQFPEIADPIQMRWDSRGRLWLSCSTTYPHVYPGREPDDRLVILEDTDGDGRADKSTVFADDLHIPLSFEFGHGGVYVSEEPYLTFLKDTNGDGKADLRQRLLTGFGTEDSHHSLHDFAWTPDGDLIFRESIFLHSQIETPYGPVRQRDSGWFRFQPRTQRLTAFGSYPSTNPWGVTFDDWGQHVASHPVYAAAFHSLNPPYPLQHPRPVGLRAYSGTCGQEFVDFPTFPKSMQGGFIKVRYKPTNRVEIHKWVEQEFGYDEQYVSDLIFSQNLSFIPVDVRFGPRGALYVCDWYNPIKGHMQYSLRDERRDRHSGRIWRITAKGQPLQKSPQIAGASIPDLLDTLKRQEYRYRYWTKRELRLRDPDAVKMALDQWVRALDRRDPRFRHHQIEAVWTYRGIDRVNIALLRDLLECPNHHARAAATQQLRYWHSHLPDATTLLRRAANDSNGLVRMQACIAASYIGTREALDAMLDVLKYPRGGSLAYAITCALGSHTLRRYWEGNPHYNIARILKKVGRTDRFKEPPAGAGQAQFDGQQDLKLVKISCIPERMLFTVKQFIVRPGQPVKIVFTNPDATDHNLVVIKPGALAEVGMAANEMARNPRNANSNFHPPSKKHLILHAMPMIGPTRRSLVAVLRFEAPTKRGLYPYVCTFPGHWIVMNGVMVVADNADDAKALLAAGKPQLVKKWMLGDFPKLTTRHDEQTVMRGMQAFVKARCNQCHKVAGHGLNLGPDLSDVSKRYKGRKLLQQMLEPSSEINKKFQPYQFLMSSGKVIAGIVVKETPLAYHVATNLLLPTSLTRVSKADVEEKVVSKISPMPEGLLNVLTREEIVAVASFLESGGYKLPPHLQHKHSHK